MVFAQAAAAYLSKYEILCLASFLYNGVSCKETCVTGREGKNIVIQYLVQCLSFCKRQIFHV